MSTPQPAPKAKKPPRLFDVADAFYLTPHMIRVQFRGDMGGIPSPCEGANCKIFIPHRGETRDAFAARLIDGPAPQRRTYTVRRFDPEAGLLTIDFVAHGDEGPASAWAMDAVEHGGGHLGFAGPSQLKIEAFEADFYLVAADMSALPVASAVLETMPRDAKGLAIFEVQSKADRQEIDMPEGITPHWVIQDDPHQASTAQEEFFRALDWPKGRIQTCIAGESGVVRALRLFLHREKEMDRKDTYISGYWKIGLIEDEHQKVKRLEVD